MFRGGECKFADPSRNRGGVNRFPGRETVGEKREGFSVFPVSVMEEDSAGNSRFFNLFPVTGFVFFVESSEFVPIRSVE